VTTLKSTPQGTLWVCYDCHVANVNDEWPQSFPETLPSLRIWWEYNRPLPWAIEFDTDVTPGLMAEHHSDYCTETLGESCECEGIEFSWNGCHGCGSTLGGSRYAYTWWLPTPVAA
jgi:hypothetical protein